MRNNQPSFFDGLRLTLDDAINLSVAVDPHGLTGCDVAAPDANCNTAERSDSAPLFIWL